jgi:hypothetical protein
MPILVYHPVVASTQKHEIGQGRRTTMRPVLDVMCLDEPQVASWEAADLVAV